MEATTKLHVFFKEKLLYWHHHINTRTLPWKEETDPYRIWLSEIILQQTRVEQGLPYYYAFIKKYPTLRKLAGARDEEAFRLWQGLGYYSRCKNLLKTARIITDHYKGIFPNTYESIISLPGVGSYTAAAIASFAFGLPYPVVDGNVYRVLSRFYGINTPVNTADGKKLFYRLAEDLLDKKNPADYNQAIMDYGALVCKPRAPLCEQCLLSAKCFAYNMKMVSLLPAKEKKLKIKTRCFHYFLLQYKNEVYVQQRLAKDIWQHLYEPYLIESENDFAENPEWKILQQQSTPEVIFQHKQQLTHQTINSKFYQVDLKKKIKGLTGKWIAQAELRNLAFPKTIVSFFHQKNYF